MSENHIRPWRNIYRRKSRQIHVGNVPIGGDAPIAVQTMTNTLTTDIKSTIEQVVAASEVGADLVRVSVPDLESSKALKEIVKESQCQSSLTFTSITKRHRGRRSWSCLLENKSRKYWLRRKSQRELFARKR